MLTKAKSIIVKEEDRKFIGAVAATTQDAGNIYRAVVTAYLDGMATGAALASNVPPVSENVKIPRETA